MERVVIKARQYQQCALILMMLCYIFFFNQANGDEVRSGKFPLVVSTWPFLEAVRAAWTAVDGGLSAIDAVVEGCSACEQLRCDGTGQNPLMPNTCLLELQLAAVVECLQNDEDYICKSIHIARNANIILKFLNSTLLILSFFTYFQYRTVLIFISVTFVTRDGFPLSFCLRDLELKFISLSIHQNFSFINDFIAGFSLI